MQEARAAAALNHPHIAVVHEIDESDDVTFIAMELMEGRQLSLVLKRDRLPMPRVLVLAIEVAEVWRAPTSAAWCTAISSPPT